MRTLTGRERAEACLEAVVEELEAKGPLILQQRQEAESAKHSAQQATIRLQVHAQYVYVCVCVRMYKHSGTAGHHQTAGACTIRVCMCVRTYAQALGTAGHHQTAGLYDLVQTRRIRTSITHSQYAKKHTIPPNRTATVIGKRRTACT